MEAITGFIEKLNLEKLVPNLQVLLGHMKHITRSAMLLGPAVMLILGLLYLFAPPREANRKFGFRTYFGMGSVEAWRFTQRIAGFVFSGMGLVLGIVMLIISGKFGSGDAMAMMMSAVKCLMWQVILTAAACIGISAASAVMFDKNGIRRR